MRLEISWKSFENVQTKTFKSESACITWVVKNSRNIVRVNGMNTYGKSLSFREVVSCLDGIAIDIPSVQIAPMFGFDLACIVA